MMFFQKGKVKIMVFLAIVISLAFAIHSSPTDVH